MKKTTILYLLLLPLAFSCGSQHERNSQATGNSTAGDCISNNELLRGSWQSSDFWNSYTEIELSDSMRCYVNHGEYVGPTVAEEYRVQNDTLFRPDNGLRYHICIKDSSTVELTDELGKRYEWKRFQPQLTIKGLTETNDAFLKEQFLERERTFSK